MARNTNRKIHSLTPILDPASGRHYTAVPVELLAQARAEGCCLHHEYEEEVQQHLLDYDDDDEPIYEEVRVTVRDEWYAATPEWVADYHRSGGTWGYND